MFPAEFPQAELLELLSVVEGQAQDVPVKKAVEDAYDVLGYGLKVGLPEGVEPPRMAFARAPHGVHVAMLRSAAASGQAGSIDWVSMIPVLISLIQKLLGGA